jgi:hypothetical protein
MYFLQYFKNVAGLAKLATSEITNRKQERCMKPSPCRSMGRKLLWPKEA